MTVITSVLFVFFLFASSIKVLGWQPFIFNTQLAFFKKYGLTRTHMFLVGLIEMTAALLLIASLILNLDLLLILGALSIAFTSIGALFFHFRYDTFKDAVPALITLALSSILLIHQI
ncbi:DoxX family protein [Pseudoalteromonas spongiae]|uniref:DoxX family protein n=1 Tax=Pseudoalteromonas spongiae TaxID=298657 RepID=A0ABU8EWU6_9GAMM